MSLHFAFKPRGHAVDGNEHLALSDRDFARDPIVPQYLVSAVWRTRRQGRERAKVGIKPLPQPAGLP
jgi:hypothetical protein